MPDDAAILRFVQKAFAHCERPEHFTDYTHCQECEEYDKLLRSRDIDTLDIEDVGNQACDPLCFTLTEGFAYFFPALARLTLSEPKPGHGWYIEQLLFHLNYEGKLTDI